MRQHIVSIDVYWIKRYQSRWWKWSNFGIKFRSMPDQTKYYNRIYWVRTMINESIQYWTFCEQYTRNCLRVVTAFSSYFRALEMVNACQTWGCKKFTFGNYQNPNKETLNHREKKRNSDWILNLKPTSFYCMDYFISLTSEIHSICCRRPMFFASFNLNGELAMTKFLRLVDQIVSYRIVRAAVGVHFLYLSTT